MSIRFTDNPKEAMVVTHAGKFHADDVFSLVFLEMYFDKDIIVYRSLPRLPEANSLKPDVIMVDIGDGMFDHHQKNGNGYHSISDVYNKPIPYASFGLLWEAFGKTFCAKYTNNPLDTENLWKNIEENLVLGIDAFDNGIYPKSHINYDYKLVTISNLISMLNPTALETLDYAQGMEKAISIAKIVFNLIIQKGLSDLGIIDTTENANTKNYFTAEQICITALTNRLALNNSTLLEDEDFKFHPLKKELQDTTFKPVPTSLFGRLWEVYGRKYCDSIYKDAQMPNYVWEFVKTFFIIGMDAEFNGIHPSSKPGYVNYNVITFAKFIELLNPTEYSEKAFDDAKNTAIDFVNLVFDRVLQKAVDRIKSRPYVQRKIKESTMFIPHYKRKLTDSSKRILILNRHVHWEDWVANSPIARNLWFVITPSNQEGYTIYPIPCKYNENGYRKGFPSEWYGLKDKELQKATNVFKASFIHPSGFIGTTRDLKSAVLLAKRAFYNKECARIVPEQEK